MTVAAVLSLASVDSCQKIAQQKQSLAVPELKIDNCQNGSFVVVWSAVENAVGYECEFDSNATETVSECSYGKDGLEAGKTYTLKVRALADEDSEFTSSEWAQIEIVMGENEPDFVIDCEVRGRMIYVDVYPADKQGTYYAEVIDKITYDEYGTDPKVVFGKILEYYEEIFGNGTYDFLKDVGDLSFDMDMNAYSMEAYVIVGGIDQQLNITTSVVTEYFITDELPVSDNTFSVEFKNVTGATIQACVTPSNDDPYTMILIESESMEGFTEDEIYDLFCKQYSVWIKDHVYNGYMEMNYNSGLFPETEYTLFVFGWDTMPNTDISKFYVTTTKAESGESLTFEMEAEVLGPNEVYTHIIPSRNDMYYFSDVLPVNDYEPIKDDLKTYYSDLSGGWGMPLIEYIRMFADSGESEYTYDYLESGTEHVFYAVGLSIDGDEVTFHTPYEYDQTLVTPEE